MLDIQAGKIKKMYADDPLEMEYTCVLDICDEGGYKLEQISKIYQLSRERIRQIIEHSLREMRFKHVAATIRRRI